MCKLFVGSLSWEVNDDELRAEFEKFGQVEEAVVVKEFSSGRSRGFGFVRYFKEADAQVAIREMDKFVFRGRPVEVRMATPRGGADGGGGFGGRGGYNISHGGGGGGGGGGGYPQTFPYGDASQQQQQQQQQQQWQYQYSQQGYGDWKHDYGERDQGYDNTQCYEDTQHGYDGYNNNARQGYDERYHQSYDNTHQGYDGSNQGYDHPQ